MLDQGLIRSINHVLRQQEWPLARLQAFAGRTLTIRLSPMPDLRLSIGEDGLLAPQGVVSATGGQEDGWREQPADLTVTLKPAAVIRILQQDAAALRDVELTGAADLAQLVQQLFRELRWDAEEDLSRVFGDVVAHRMVSTGRDFIVWQKDAAQRLAQNLAEYWTEEQPLLVPRENLSRFADDVARAGSSVDALERRIVALEHRRAGSR
jgi:ubiquinone biosynthesis protein UbiJ